MCAACRDVELQPAESVRGVERVWLGQMVRARVDVAVTAVFRLVGVHHVYVFALRGEDSVAGERLRRIEVEHENEVAALERQHLVVVLVPQFLHRGGLEIAHAAHQVYHIVVETPEELVLQFLAVNQIPLAARVFI